MLDFPIKSIQNEDLDYPKLLKEVKKRPNTLYYRGDLQNQNKPDSRGFSLNIGIVGSRKMTIYGKQAVEFLVSSLKSLPVCIVSGLAYGIDAHAHQIAIKTGLKTWAVLGSGVDDASIYPRANLGLAHNILKSGGAILSSYPPGTEAREWHFPERNLIIAGLCQGVIIAEAAEKSGALITAKHALDENRDVFAVPGSIFQKSSKGTNNLIKTSRAKPITEISDLINEYSYLKDLAAKFNFSESIPETSGLTEIQKQIFNAIAFEGTGIDEILEKTGLAVEEINSNLVFLEIQNRIRGLGNNFYAKSPSSRSV